MSGMVQHMQFKGSGGTLSPAFGTASMPIDLRWASSVAAIISGLATETYALQVSFDQGVTWSASIRPIDLATGALAAASTLGNGSYVWPNFPGGWVKLVKSGSTDNATISLHARSK